MLAPNSTDWYCVIHQLFLISLRFGCQNKVVNGKPVKDGKAPWHAILEDLNCATLCGGSIINIKFILTAAHCIDSYKKHPWTACPEKYHNGGPLYPSNIAGKYNLVLNSMKLN